MIDITIIEECRKGDFTNFRIIVSEVSPYAYSVAFRMTGSEDEAREIVQDTMVTIWQKIERIKSPEAFRTWMYRIVINKCYDYLRSKKRNPERRMSDADWGLLSSKLGTAGETALEQEETAALINSLSSRLSPKQKAVFILCDLEDMPYEEAAVITGVSSRNIKANLHYARKKMSEMLEKYL